MFRRSNTILSRLYSTASTNTSSRTPILRYVALGSIFAVTGAATTYYYYSQNSTLSLPKLRNNPQVVFVLGGPGAGKGTQCAKLVKEFGFEHLSAGDLLRAEQSAPNSPYGDLIKSYILDGQIVPMEITIALLHAAMTKSGKVRFLIDGFPRAMDQALKFEQEVCSPKFVLYFECPESELLKRLLNRGVSSGRIDDNIESIKKRFKTFFETSLPVVQAYEREGRVVRVSCLNDVGQVYAEVRSVFERDFETVVPAVVKTPIEK